MKITVLIDNTPSDNKIFFAEKGLSIYIETSRRKILVDTGLTGKAFNNAASMSIDISDVDILVLSHGHIDHTGGLKRFINANNKAKIYASSLIYSLEYYSNRHGKVHSLSPDYEVFKQNYNRFVLLKDNTEICKDVYAVFNNTHLQPRPLGNKYLTVEERETLKPYVANDEIALAIKKKEGLAIFSPCTHSGLLNIIPSCVEYTKEQTVQFFLGGLHLLDEEAEVENNYICYMADSLLKLYPNIKLYTGHCTEERACYYLSTVLKENFIKFKTGDVYNL